MARRRPGRAAGGFNHGRSGRSRHRPLRIFSIYKVGKRTHRKVLVVDGRIAYTGGLGIEKRWLGNARNTNEWRDTHVRVEGPVVAQMQAIFSEDWTYTTGGSRGRKVLSEDRSRRSDSHSGHQGLARRRVVYSIWDHRGIPKRMAEVVSWIWEPYY
jgi:phosphatidylserine/phosphatidylglycerophosphate/cardiolipin synthase-like enzyme